MSTVGRTTDAAFDPERRAGASAEISRTLEIIPDPALVVDSSGRIVAANSELSKMFGYSPAELEELGVDDLVARTGRDRHAAHEMFAESAGRRRMGTGLDVRGVRKDGTEFPLEISLNPIPAETGLLVCATFREVSETAGFLRAFAHELRTPLSATLVASEILASWGEQLPQERTAEIASMIHANTRSLDRLLVDLLDVDRLARGVIQAQRSDTDVHALARDVIDGLDRSGNHVHVVEGAPVVTRIDPDQTRRIFENLLMNAIRRSPAQAPIRVTIRSDAGGTILVVEDAGPEVADDQKHEIFEAFRRSDGVNRAPGTGVGLSLVAKFAALHDGRAWVEDRDGGGAAFHVFLRDAPDPESGSR